MRISCFFALVFLMKDLKLIRCSDSSNGDNKGRKERKCASLSAGFVPSPVLSFILLKGRSTFWQKQYSSAHLPDFLAGLGPLNTTMFLNRMERDQRTTAVILNLALGIGLWTSKRFCVLINYSPVYFSGDGVHSLY